MYLPGSSCQLVLWPCTWQTVHRVDTQHSLPPKPGFLIKQKKGFWDFKYVIGLLTLYILKVAYYMNPVVQEKNNFDLQHFL